MCDLHNHLQNCQKNAPKTLRRKKLWELDIHWHCAIVGTCISQTELNKLGLKVKAPTFEGGTAEYKLHSFMVGQARFGKDVGKVLHKFLERKFARSIRAFSKAKNDPELLELWQDAVSRGFIPGAFWAVMTHENCSLDLQARIYGEVHMMSHQVGAGIRADQRKLADLEATVDVLQSELRDQRAQQRKAIDKRDHIIGQLKKEKQAGDSALRRVDELEAMLLQERDGESLARLERRIDNLTLRVVQEAERADAALRREKETDEILKAANESIKTYQSRVQDLEVELLNLQSRSGPAQEMACFKEDGCEGEGDLCGRCIAYIGGQTKQAAYFRDYVEKQNGEFLHHDGGLHDGQARLMNILSQADAVMFPVTCISHEASREIKKVCQQQNKPFMPLRSQGLGAFTRGIQELVKEE